MSGKFRQTSVHNAAMTNFYFAGGFNGFDKFRVFPGIHGGVRSIGFDSGWTASNSGQIYPLKLFCFQREVKLSAH